MAKNILMRYGYERQSPHTIYKQKKTTNGRISFPMTSLMKFYKKLSALLAIKLLTSTVRSG